MDSIDDPVFGNLQRDGMFLERQFDVFIFGENKTVKLIVDEQIKPTNNEREIFMEFDKHKEKCVKDVEESVYAYYLSLLEEKRADFEESADEYMPIISNINELKALVSLDTIIIKDQYYKYDGIIAFLFECSWDDHGIGVKLEGNTVTDVGFQDIVL